MSAISLGDKQHIGAFGIAIFTVSIILSFVGMMMMAKLGSSMLFYYGLVAIFFFVPTVMVTIELAKKYPSGGMYQWVKHAFGKEWAFISLWIQWGVVMITMPQLFTFISGLFAMAVHPTWIHQGYYVFIVCILLSSFSLGIARFGIKASTIVTTFAVITTLLLPILLILIFSCIWLVKGLPVQTKLDWSNMVPHLGSLGTYTLLGITVLAFSGVEAPAYLMKYMKKPSTFSKGIIVSAVIIIGLNILVTLALTIFVSPHHESIITGLMQSFSVFLDYFHVRWIIYIYVTLALLGYIGVLTSYLITYAEAVFASSEDKMLPSILSHRNSYGVPINILMIQTVICIALSGLFLIIPHVSDVYWLLNAVIAIGLCLRYILLFVARYKLATWEMIPLKRNFYHIMTALGVLSVIIAIVVLYFPPNQFPVGNVWTYEVILAIGTLSYFFIPLCVLKLRKIGSAR